jgi:hypothetical protein
MRRRSRDGSNIVKFPIGRVVREHRIGLIVGATSAEEAIEQSLISMRRAITTLRRQESTLFLALYHADALPWRRRAVVDRAKSRICWIRKKRHG